MSTDLREGLSAAEHAVLDKSAEFAGSTDPVEYHLRLAERAAAAAVRAKPETGMGRRRVERAREAAAQLIAALNRMGPAGEEMKPW